MLLEIAGVAKGTTVPKAINKVVIKGDELSFEPSMQCPLHVCSHDEIQEVAS